jgi:hypothetical protein
MIGPSLDETLPALVDTLISGFQALLFSIREHNKIQTVLTSRLEFAAHEVSDVLCEMNSTFQR